MVLSVVKYLVYLFILVFVLNTQAGVDYLTQLPENGGAIALCIVSKLTEFQSLEELNKDLKSKSINEIKCEYTINVDLENGCKSDVCGICHCAFKKQGKSAKQTFTSHLKEHWMLFTVLKGLNDEGQSVQNFTQQELKKITSVDQLIDDKDTCLACYLMMQPSRDDIARDRGSNQRMMSHVGFHKSIEQRSERICTSHAKSLEENFSNLTLQDAVNENLKAYEDGRVQLEADKESGVVKTKKRKRKKRKKDLSSSINE